MIPTASNTDKLSGFNIIHRAFDEISAKAENCGIDANKLLQQITPGQAKYTKGIASERKYEGKVAAFLNIRTARNGHEYPVVTFNTFAHGGHSETFNGYDWLKDQQGFGLSSPCPVSAPKPAKAKGETDRQWRINRFDQFRIDYALLPALTDTEGTYLGKKGFDIKDIPAGFEIRQGSDGRGRFIVFPLKKNSLISGYQKIYDNFFADQNGTVRDKDFIFYPESKNSSYAIFGNPQKGQKIYLCEGLATALSVFLATRCSVAVCLDAGNLDHVAKFLHNDGYTDIVIAADNDLTDHGNAGLFAALQAARYTSARIVYAELDDKKCDFDDVRQALGLDAVRMQLENNWLIPDKSMGHHFSLIPYANSQQLKSVIEKSCHFAVNHLIYTLVDYRRIYKRISRAARARGFLDGKHIKRYIKKCIKARLRVLEGKNRITNLAGVTVIEASDNESLCKTISGLGNAIVIDTRPMATGKTLLMGRVADNSRGRKPSHDEIRQFHFAGGGTEQQWLAINDSPSLFVELQACLISSNVKNTVYTCHRTALVDMVSNDMGLANYQDIPKGVSTDSLAVCVNSMPAHNVSQRVNTLLVDELRQTLEHVLNGTVDNRIAVYNEFVASIQNADLVLAADSDMNDSALEWIKGITNKPIFIIVQKPIKNSKTVFRMGNHNAVLNHAKEALKTGKSVWIAADSLQQTEKAAVLLNAEELRMAMLDGSGLCENDILLIHGENKGDPRQAAFLANPNKESSKYKVVIHSPVISSGVSIVNGHFDAVYGMFSGVLQPNEIAQTIGRVRTASEIIVSFRSNHAKDRPTDVNDLVDGETIKRSRFSVAEGQCVITDFDKLRLKHIATRNDSLNNYIGESILYLQMIGYRFKDLDLTHEKIAGLSKAVKAKRINAILTASEIDTKQAEAIEKKTASTQAETDSLHLHKVTQMTGKPYSDIDKADVDFYLDKGLSIVSNHETITAHTDDLIDSDVANHEKRDRLGSKTSKQFLINLVLGMLTGQTINAEMAKKACEILRKHQKELAANGLGNYTNVSKQPVKQLSGFLNKFGYELVMSVQKHSGERFYEARINLQVQTYVDNRALLKQHVVGHTWDFFYIQPNNLTCDPQCLSGRVLGGF